MASAMVRDALPYGFHLDAYAADGVAVLRGVFSPEYTTALREGWRSLKASLPEHRLERRARFIWGVLPSPVGVVWQHPALVAIANAILGANVSLYMNRLLVKDEHWTGAVTIHQDQPYFNGGHHKFSIFVPLESMQAEGGNGGLKFVLGSHKYGNLERGRIERTEFDPMPDLAPDLQVGDIAVMDFLTWHYSEDSAVPGERPLLQITYQPSDDGSFGGARFGVAEPTLVSGAWQTRYFAECRKGITPDA